MSPPCRHDVGSDDDPGLRRWREFCVGSAGQERDQGRALAHARCGFRPMRRVWDTVGSSSGAGSITGSRVSGSGAYSDGSIHFPTTTEAPYVRVGLCSSFAESIVESPAVGSGISSGIGMSFAVDSDPGSSERLVPTRWPRCMQLCKTVDQSIFPHPSPVCVAPPQLYIRDRTLCGLFIEDKHDLFRLSR
jgi:hypothetical protein